MTLAWPNTGPSAASATGPRSAPRPGTCCAASAAGARYAGLLLYASHEPHDEREWEQWHTVIRKAIRKEAVASAMDLGTPREQVAYRLIHAHSRRRIDGGKPGLPAIGPASAELRESPHGRFLGAARGNAPPLPDEVESAYFEIKKTMLGRRVLRARTPAGIAQEVYALLAVYQIIRIAIADATGSAPGTDPDRASFTIALETARDQVIQAANVIAGTVIDLVGTIGRRVLDNLMPDRRLRLSPRAVKRPLSRYAYKSLKIDRRSYKATLSIDILIPPISP